MSMEVKGKLKRCLLQRSNNYPVVMNKAFNKTVLLCGLLPTISTKEISFEQYKAARGLYILDPWERVKSIFSKDDFGRRHPELVYAIQMTELGLLVGMCYGGVLQTFIKSEEFVHSNDANIYSNKREAFKALANHSLVSFVKGGLKRAPTFGIFTGGFFLVSSCCEAYRNKPEIIDSTVAGAVVGGLSRFMFGIKGMISGAILGTVLGTIYGTSVWLLLKISKTDQTELKYAQFAMTKYKAQFLDKPNEKPLGQLDSTWSKDKENLLEDLKRQSESSKDTAKK